jgi:hypothetical protein
MANAFGRSLTTTPSGAAQLGAQHIKLEACKP